MIQTHHIVKSYDADFKKLNQMLWDMSNLVVSQMDKSIVVLEKRDKEQAQEIINDDRKIDQFEHDVDAFAVRMIALRQPVARDLRAVVSALKISSHLERIADYAVNIAKRTLTLGKEEEELPIAAVKSMADIVKKMINDILHAYEESDYALAMEVWQRDKEIDNLYNSYLRAILTYMMEKPQQIGVYMELLFVAKHLERAGDHVRNIAEMVHYLIYGTPFEEEGKEK
jgi:phosphate transport system protein